MPALTDNKGVPRTQEFLAKLADKYPDERIALGPIAEITEFMKLLERELSASSERKPSGWMDADQFVASLPGSPSSATRATLAPNVDGRNFYELCQQYRHAREIERPGRPNAVQAFNNLREYIKTGALPWEPYDE